MSCVCELAVMRARLSFSPLSACLTQDAAASCAAAAAGGPMHYTRAAAGGPCHAAAADGRGGVQEVRWPWTPVLQSIQICGRHEAH